VTFGKARTTFSMSKPRCKTMDGWKFGVPKLLLLNPKIHSLHDP
jgi:hypothetical protein